MKAESDSAERKKRQTGIGNYSGDSDYRDTRLAVGIKEEEKEEEEDTGRKSG